MAPSKTKTKKTTTTTNNSSHRRPFTHINWPKVSSNLGVIVDAYCDLEDLAETLGYGKNVAFPNVDADDVYAECDRYTAELIIARLIASGAHAKAAGKPNEVSINIADVVTEQVLDADFMSYKKRVHATVLRRVCCHAPIPKKLVVPHDRTRGFFTDAEWRILFDHIRAICDFKRKIVGELPLDVFARTKLDVVAVVDPE
jgi:hypothetical protein